MNSTKDSSIIIIGEWAYTTSTLLPMQKLSAEEGGGPIIRHERIIHRIRYMHAGARPRPVLLQSRMGCAGVVARSWSS